MKKRSMKTPKVALAIILSAAMLIVGSFAGAPDSANAADGDTVTDTTLDAKNLVTNGNFADGVNGWGTDNCTITAAVVDGSNVGYITNRGNNFAAIIQNINGGPFQRGDVLEFSFKIKRAATPNNDKYFELCLKYDDGEDQFPQVTKNSDNESNPYCHTDHWTTISGTHTVGMATNVVQLNIREPGYQDYGGNTEPHDYYIDDIQIVRTFAATPPPATPTPTPRVTRSPKPTATPKATATPQGSTATKAPTAADPSATKAPDASQTVASPAPTTNQNDAYSAEGVLKVSGKKTITLKLSNKKKKSAKLKATLINLKGTVKWKIVKGKKIIKLNKKKGKKVKITAKKVGKATIRITCGGLKVTKKVKVKK